MASRSRREAKHASGRRPISADRLRGPWYVLWGARLLVGGIPLALLVCVVLLAIACNTQFAAVFVPGSAVVGLDPGAYSVHYEYPASLPWSRTPEVEFELTSRESGTVVPLQPPGVDESGSQGGRASVLLYHAEVPAPGVYELRAWYTRDDTRSDIAITIGRGPTERALRFLTIAVFSVAGIGIWILVMVLVSRYFHPPVSRAKPAKQVMTRR